MAKEVVIPKKQANIVLAVLNDPRTYRARLAGTPIGVQKGFWGQYGVTQSGGSRYETGRDMDTPLRTLMALHLCGIVTTKQLDAARELAEK